MKKFLAAGILLTAMTASAFGCTVLGVGKNASVDGSAMVSHTCDSYGDTFATYIVPAADWPKDSQRDVIMGRHGTPGAQPVFRIPQVPHTFRYLAANYSFINEKGFAMSESTFWPDETDERSKKVCAVMNTNTFGPMDAFVVQDVALERCATAREAVKVMGDLVSQYGWGDSGETMPITDGNEVWIMEFYGNKMWAAWRLPDDQVFVAANRARLRHLDLTDKDNVMAAPDIISYAVEQGFISKKDANEKDFSPADVFAPNIGLYSMRREWRALSLLAPQTYKGGADDEVQPMSVKPDKKISVADVLRISSDWYEGTPYDLSKGPAAGPWGDPLRYANSSESDPKATWERSINMHRCTYVHVCQVKADLPEQIKGVAWFGYGAPDTAYLTPLWASMKSLPDIMNPVKGSTRYSDYSSDSAWWAAIRLQHIAEMRYQDARKEIHAVRDPKLAALYHLVPAVQQVAADLIKKGDVDGALDVITDFGCAQALDWHATWLALGDRLFSTYALGTTHMKKAPYPDWWNKQIGFGPVERQKKQ